jgi:integrase
MGIKYDESKECWSAFYSKRHPITRIPTGLRRTNLASKSEALRVEKELVIEVEHKLNKTITPSWKEVVERFAVSAHERGVSEKSISNNTYCLKAHTLEAWGGRLVNQISGQDIRVLLQAKVGHRAQSHQKYVLGAIRAAFVYAVDQGYIQVNPTPQIKFKVSDKIKAVLTEEQARSLLSKARDYGSEWYFHWAMALYSGMRNGELYALTWDKVDLDKRQIKVDCAWNNKDGFKSTKSGDDRIVEIALPLLQVLRQLKLQSSDSQFVLPRLCKWDDGDQARELRMFLQGIGLPPVRFHDLRATWATILLSRGVAPIKVMKMGGWKTMDTMMIYARKAGVDVKGATDCLDLHDPNPKSCVVLPFDGECSKL